MNKGDFQMRRHVRSLSFLVIGVVLGLAVAPGCRCRWWIFRDWVARTIIKSSDKFYSDPAEVWFDESRPAKDFYCFGGVDERCVRLHIANQTKEDMIVRYCDYAMRYIDVNGRERDAVYEDGCSYYWGRIEVLTPAVENDFLFLTYTGFKTMEVPEDCKEVQTFSVRIEALTFAEFAQCKDYKDLDQAFENKRAYCIVDLSSDRPAHQKKKGCE